MTYPRYQRLFNIAALFLFAALLAGCASSSRYRDNSDSMPSNYQNFDADDIPNAVPKVEPPSRYGNPSSYVVLGQRYYVLHSSVGYKERGIASFYGVKFHNYKTSNGEIYNMYGMTAANKVLPLPTYVRVTNLENHKQVIVRVNDRGPFHVNRIIDLSFAAAKKLDMIKTGTALVEVEAIDPRQPAPTAKPAVVVTHIASTSTSAKPVIYLQLGAFSTNAAAERFEQRIQQYTQRPIRIVAGASQGLAIYRVQVGPVASVDEADALTATFKQHGLGDAFAVVD